MDKTNPVGAEYIIVEKLPGVPLAEVWAALNAKDRVDVCMQILAFQKKRSSARFSQFGSLYHSKDIPSSDPQRPLYFDEEGRPVHNPRFAVGPSVGREWVDDGKQNVQCDRGPCELFLCII